MNPNEYVRLASVTRSGINPNLDDDFMDNIHMMLGVMSEAGELADIFKKNLSYGTPIDWTNIREELGDLLWYIAGFCDINGISLGEVMKINISKLIARYPEGFIEHDAIHRDLDYEREVLEEPITIYPPEWLLDSEVKETDELKFRREYEGSPTQFQENLFCFTEGEMLALDGLLHDVSRTRYCPSCKKIKSDGHTNSCEFVRMRETVKRLLDRPKAKQC